MFCSEYFKNFNTILKNISKRLVFNFFNGSLLHGPKGLRSRLYDGVRLQGPSYRSSFCSKVGISRPEASPNLHSKTLDKYHKLVVLDGFRSF